MSIFNDKALKGVAAEVAKIMGEELKGNQHKIDANKNGKIDAQDFKLLRSKKNLKEDDTGYQDRYAVKNGKAVKHNPARGERDEPHHVWADSAEHAVRKHAAKTAAPMKEETEQLQEYESKGGTYKHKGNYGTSYKTDEEGNEIKPAKQKGYGARQNYVRGTSTGEKKKMKESLSFTEMLELYNEHGLKVLAPIETEEMDIDGTTIEVIDADKINGVVATAIEEEATEEEFNKELKDQQDSFAGKKKQPKVVAGKTTGVKTMPEEVEQIDELSHDTLRSYVDKAKKENLPGKGGNRGVALLTPGTRDKGVHKAVDRMKKMKANEEVELDERTLTPAETAKKEEIVKSMKKGLAGFKQRYGERAKEVMYATATKQAKKD